MRSSPGAEALLRGSVLVALFVRQSVDSSVFRFHWAHFLFVYLLGAGTRLVSLDTPEPGSQHTNAHGTS